MTWARLRARRSISIRTVRLAPHVRFPTPRQSRPGLNFYGPWGLAEGFGAVIWPQDAARVRSLPAVRHSGAGYLLVAYAESAIIVARNRHLTTGRFGSPNGWNRPFAALQDRSYERAVSARKRSLAEGVDCTTGSGHPLSSQELRPCPCSSSRRVSPTCSACFGHAVAGGIVAAALVNVHELVHRDPT